MEVEINARPMKLLQEVSFRGLHRHRHCPSYLTALVEVYLRERERSTRGRPALVAAA